MVHSWLSAIIKQLADSVEEARKINLKNVTVNLPLQVITTSRVAHYIEVTGWTIRQLTIAARRYSQDLSNLDIVTRQLVVVTQADNADIVSFCNV